MNKTINILATALVSVFGTHGYCQEAPTKTPTSLSFILDMEGQWEGPAVMNMGGKEVNVPYYADFKKTADNNGIVMFEHCTIPGMGVMNGTNLIGFDPNDQKIHWYSVDNMGTTHEHIGDLTDKTHFNMVNKGLHDGKQYVETIDITRAGKDKILFKLVATLDGKEDQSVNATFSRKHQSSKVAKK